MHVDDVLPADPGRVRDYNPPQPGHACYFTTSGNQIRSPRLFSVYNVSNRIKNYDDESTTSKCSKKHRSLALKSTTYICFYGFVHNTGIVMDSILMMGVKGEKILPIL